MEGQFLRQSAYSHARSNIREATITEQRTLMQDTRKRVSAKRAKSELKDVRQDTAAKDVGHFVYHSGDLGVSEQSAGQQPLHNASPRDEACAVESDSRSVCCLRLRGTIQYCT